MDFYLGNKQNRVMTSHDIVNCTHSRAPLALALIVSHLRSDIQQRRLETMHLPNTHDERLHKSILHSCPLFADFHGVEILPFTVPVVSCNSTPDATPCILNLLYGGHRHGQRLNAVSLFFSTDAITK